MDKFQFIFMILSLNTDLKKTTEDKDGLRQS